MPDVLEDKNYKTYEDISRYSSFPYYYHTEDNKYIYGITSHIDKSTSYVAHKVRQGDTLDNLSLTYYGRPDYYWMIADFNDILDPYEQLWGKYETLNIPTFTSINYVD